MDSAYIFLILTLLALIPLFVALSSALFKLYRDIISAFSAASDAGSLVSALELEKIKQDINIIGRIFMAIGSKLPF